MSIRFYHRIIAIFISVASCAGVALADTVFLKNGNQMEGTVQSESKTQIDLDIGYGSVTLEKADILRIKRLGFDTHGKVTEAEAGEFEAGDHIPNSASELDDDFRNLRQLRQRARDALDLKTADEESAESAEQDVSKPSDRDDGQVHNFQPSPTAAEMARVTEMKRIASQAVVDHAPPQQPAQDARQTQAAISDYVKAYDALRDRLKETDIRRAITTAKGWDKKYWVWVQAGMADIGRDFKKDTIKSIEKRGKHVVVNARINGLLSARLVVDSGSAVTILSQAVAAGLGLDDGSEEESVTPGRRIRAPVVRLDSISVGKTKLNNVYASIVPSGAPGADGLLGMNFLNHFTFKIDAPHGILVLNSFQPQ